MTEQRVDRSIRCLGSNGQNSFLKSVQLSAVTKNLLVCEKQDDVVSGGQILSAAWSSASQPHDLHTRRVLENS